MSYINDALKKAQTERNGHHMSCAPLLTTAERNRRRFRVKAMIIGLGILSFLLVCAAVLWGVSEWGNSAHQVHHSSKGDVSAVKTEIIPADEPKNEKGASAVTAIVESTKEGVNEPNITKTERVSKKDHKDLLPLYLDAIKLQRQQQFEAAEKIYLRILKRDAKHVYALNNLGVIYLSQRRFAKSRGMFQRAMKGDEHYVEPFYNMACLYAQLKDQQQSILYLKKAIVINGEVRRWVSEDKDFEDLRNIEEFNQLVEERKR